MSNGSTQPEIFVDSLIRFSTVEQTAKGKAGIEGQRKVNEAAAIFHGVKIRKEHIVIDVSGSDVAQNPQFQGIFRDLENPALGLAGLLTPEQSRLVRPLNSEDFAAVLGPFERNKKVIYTPTARLDPNTSEGKMLLWFGGLRDGEELKILRDRFQRGKAAKRADRKHVSGDQGLPRTVRYVRSHDPATGREIEAHWESVPLEVARMQKAFELLFEGLPFELIAEKVGGYSTGGSLKRAMQNPIHIGIRRYEWEAAGEKKPVKARVKTRAKHEPGWEPKPRRRLAKRAAPQDVPTRQQLELWYAGDSVNGRPPIVEPIISLEAFDRAQQIIAERYNEHRKTKTKNQERPRFLANGTAMCSCGQPLYPNYGSRGRFHLDTYICKSRFHGGPGCGMHSIRRTDGDAAIETLVCRLADVTFLLMALDACLELQQTAPSPARAEYEAALAGLEEGRKEMLTLVRKGKMKAAEFTSEMDKLEAEVRALETLLPPPAPKIDPADVADLIVRVFKEFSFLSFLDKRALLQGAVKSIIVDGHARTLVSVTINGGFLGSGANSCLRSTASLAICAIPDVVVRFPQPIEIPTIVAEEMAARRETQKAATAARQPEVRVARLARRRVNESKAGMSPEAYAAKRAALAAWKRNQRAKLRENPEAYAAFLATKAAEQRARRAKKAA
jgi:DNA invertase Pin-like site-specific DNA recombinase